MPSRNRRSPRRWKYPDDQGHRLDLPDVLSRVKDHGPNHYSGLYNVMKGVTLAGGGIAFVRLANHGFSLPHIALMAVALTGVFLTYYGQSVGLVIVHLKPSILDIALPMALTVVEFFIVYRPGAPAKGALPVDWFYALAIWALLAASVVASVANRISRFDYSSRLWPVANEYRSELWRDVGAASVLAVVTAAFAAAHQAWALDTTWEYAFLAVALGMLFAGINSQGQTRRILAKHLALPV